MIQLRQLDIAVHKSQLQSILKTWYKLSREARKKFDWSQFQQATLYTFIVLIFSQINFVDMIVEKDEVHQLFLKLVSSVLKMKEINQGQSLEFDLEETFIFVLSGRGIGQIINSKEELLSSRTSQKYTKIKFSSNSSQKFYQLKDMAKISSQQSQNQIRISPITNNLKILVAEKNLIQRFKVELIKKDQMQKINFINKYLYCDHYPLYSIKSVKILTFKRNQNICLIPDKIFLLYSGSVILQIKDDNKKINLLKGAILSQNQIIRISQFVEEEQQNQIKDFNFVNQKSSQRIYKAISECIVLTIPYNDFHRCIKNEDKVKKGVISKIENVMQNRDLILDRARLAQNFVKQNENDNLQVIYSIKRKDKVSKAFRRRKSQDAGEYQQFMTNDIYNKITRNKEKVQRKHEIYGKLHQLVKEKKQQQRFLKTLNIQEGFKQVKKKELSMRLKRTRIQKLANKASIADTKKYKDQTNDIQFYFETYNEEKTPQVSTFRRWISMQEVNEKLIKAQNQSKAQFQSKAQKLEKQNILTPTPSDIFKKQYVRKKKNKKNLTCLKSMSSARCSISQL